MTESVVVFVVWVPPTTTTVIPWTAIQRMIIPDVESSLRSVRSNASDMTVILYVPLYLYLYCRQRVQAPTGVAL
jgi:hypothetical protein